MLSAPFSPLWFLIDVFRQKVFRLLFRNSSQLELVLPTRQPLHNFTYFLRTVEVQNRLFGLAGHPVHNLPRLLDPHYLFDQLLNFLLMDETVLNDDALLFNP